MAMPTALEIARQATLKPITEIAEDVGIPPWLTEQHGVPHAVGLTLSQEQAAWIGALDRPRCEVRLENWIDHPADQHYDAVISIGAFDEPHKIALWYQLGMEGKHPSLEHLDDVEAVGTTESNEDDEDLARIRKSNHQHPDHDTVSWTPQPAVLP